MMNTIFLMQASDKLIELVGNYGLKGFCLGKDNRIQPIRRLDAIDIKALMPSIETLYDNLSSYEFNNLVDQACCMVEKQQTKLVIADVESGSLLRIELDSKHIVTLVYLGDYTFCVCKDSIHALMPMDVLQCVSLELHPGEDAYFRVLRNGVSFPDEKKLFRCHILEIVISNNHVKGVAVIQPVQNVRCSELKIYAWQVNCHPLRFVQSQLTNYHEALFGIDIKEKTFEVNPKYSTTLALYRDISSILKKACNIKPTGNGLENLSVGRVSLERYQNELEFTITKRAEVGI